MDLTKISMKLHDKYFKAVDDDTKTVELRLYDLKRQVLHLSDWFIFKHFQNSDEEITVGITGLMWFKTFKEALFFIPGNKLGISSQIEYMTKNPCPTAIDERVKWIEKLDSFNLHIGSEVLKDLNKIYTKEQEEENGVLAIFFEKVAC